MSKCTVISPRHSHRGHALYGRGRAFSKQDVSFPATRGFSTRVFLFLLAARCFDNTRVNSSAGRLRRDKSKTASYKRRWKRRLQIFFLFTEHHKQEVMVKVPAPQDAYSTDNN